MITKPTVLILGAGASVDYGFPTGRGLVSLICSECKSGGSIFEFLTERMARDPRLRKFRRSPSEIMDSIC